MSERFVLAREGCDLAGERWPGGAPLVVLLHEGVSDRRGWRQVARLLAPQVTVVAYDRRGYGESAVSTAPFTHVDDVLAGCPRPLPCAARDGAPAVPGRPRPGSRTATRRARRELSTRPGSVPLRTADEYWGGPASNGYRTSRKAPT